MYKDIENIDNEGFVLDYTSADLLKKTGQEYFDGLVKFLCEKTNSRHSFIGLYDNEGNIIKTKSFYSNGVYSKQYSYILKDTPCENVLGKEMCLYTSDVQSLFPLDEGLKAMNIESYVGLPLFNLDKTPMGILVVLDKDPIEDIENIKLILELFESKTELELERLLLNEQLKLSERGFQEVFDNFQDVFFIIHYNEKNKQIDFLISPSVEEVLGYTNEDIKTLNFIDFYQNPADRKAFSLKLKEEKQVKNYPLKFKKKDGTRVYVEIDCELLEEYLPKNTAFSLRGVLKDVTDRNNKALRSEMAFLIAEKSQRRLTNVDTLAEFIFRTLNNVMDATNFYIALHDKDKNELYMPVFYDEHSNKPSNEYRVSFGNGLSEYIIRSNKVIHQDKNGLQKLINEEKIDARGKLAECFVGIPLKSEGLCFGALVLQTYRLNYHFSKEDIDLLKFISIHIAYLLERTLWRETLISKEEHYRSLVENSSEIIGIINKDGDIHYISKSLNRILGYDPFDVIGRNLSDFIKVDNLNNVLKDRINKPFENTLELLKVSDNKGNKKYLEIYLKKNKDNELIFNAKDVTQRVIADKSNDLAQKKLNTLHQIEKALLTNKPLNNILDDALKVIIKNMFDVDRASISLFNYEDEKAEILALRTKYKIINGIKVGETIPFNELASIDSTIKNTPYCLGDIEKLPKLKKSEKDNKKDGIKSYYIRPIVINDKVIGTFNFGSKTKNYFNNIDENLLEEITQLVAVVINDAIIKKDLAEREADLTTIFNSSNEGILQADNKGNFMVVNERLCEILGYTEKEMLTKNFKDITYQPDLNYSVDIFNKIIKDKIERITIDKKYQHKNGEVIDCKITIRPVFTEGKLNYITGFIEDKTEERIALKKVLTLEKTLNHSASVIFTDKNGIMTDVNQKTSDHSGYTKEDLIGQSMQIFNSSFHSRKEWESFWNKINLGKTWEGELKNRRKDGSYYWIYASVIPVLNDKKEVESFFSIRFDITKEKLAKMNTTRQVIEAQEAERERFAMEIHDGLGQTLLATKMNLSALKSAGDELNEDSKKILDKALNLLTDAVQEARNISHGLMSRVIHKFGLAYAVNQMINDVNTTMALKFKFTHNIEELRFSEELEMGLYRTLQELVKNIIKHAQATKVNLEIDRKGNELSIEIKDNGIGMEQGVLNNTKSLGIGLRNMKSRIEYLGGRFEIDQKIKKGTKIKISISL